MEPKLAYHLRKIIFLICMLAAVISANYVSIAYAGAKAVNTSDTYNYMYDPFEDKALSADDGLKVSDPLEGYNRFIFSFNDKLYFYVLKPVARGYKFIMPEEARRSVKRFFLNLATPIRLVNCLLQGKFNGAGIELYRFSVNTTVGIAGFLDPAYKVCGLTRYDEDSGQTLGHYGIGHGIYIVWPILGPSSIRETFGTVADMFLDPLFYVDLNFFESAGIEAYQIVNSTSLKIGEYEDFKKGAIDPYTSLKNAYLQNRESAINQ